MSSHTGPLSIHRQQRAPNLGRALIWVLSGVAGLGLPMLACVGVVGCGAVASNNAEQMSAERFQKGAETLLYDHDADYVWVHVKETLAHLSARQPQFNDETRRAFATVKDGSIQAGVIAVDGNRCRLAVRARQYGLPSESLAKSVLERIHEEIEP